jgi:hypothetical protein
MLMLLRKGKNIKFRIFYMVLWFSSAIVSAIFDYHNGVKILHRIIYRLSWFSFTIVSAIFDYRNGVKILHRIIYRLSWFSFAIVSAIFDYRHGVNIIWKMVLQPFMIWTIGYISWIWLIDAQFLNIFIRTVFQDRQNSTLITTLTLSITISAF